MNDLAALLEPISARGWPPRLVEPLGGWRLHAASGFGGRANACWPIGAPDRPLDQAIAAVEAWYQHHGLPPVFRPADLPETEILRQALAERSYAPRTETLVMVGPLLLTEAPGAVVSADLDPVFTDIFLASADDPGDAAERIEALAKIAAPRGFARIDVHGVPAAIGATAIEGDWAGLFGMRTLAQHRRRGLATAIIAALCRYAAQTGAGRAYLQVEAANRPAVALYRKLGFSQAYAYRYWDRR